MKKGLIIGIFILMISTIFLLGYTVIRQNKIIKEDNEIQEPKENKTQIMTKEEATKLFQQRYEKDLEDAESLEIDEKRIEELAKEICNLNISEYPVTSCLTKAKVYENFPNFTQKYLENTQVLKNIALDSTEKIILGLSGRIKALDYIRTGEIKSINITENKIEYVIEHIYCAEMSQDCKTSGNERSEEYNYVLKKIDNKWLVTEIGLPY